MPAPVQMVVVPVGGHVRGKLVRARGFMVPAGSLSFAFTRDFHYGGALYSRGSRVCPHHAQLMGVVAQEPV